MNNQSQEVCCCGAKIWTLVIGWFQAIVSSIFTLVAFCGIIWLSVTYANQDNTNITSGIGVGKDGTLGGESNHSGWIIDHAFFTAMIIILVIALIGLMVGIAMGVLLITGVNEQNARKLKIWLILQIVGMILSILILMLKIATMSARVEELFQSVICIAISAFFMWVVNVHRQEIIAAGGPTFKYEREI